MRTNNPTQIITSLSEADIQAIVPTEDWELLGNQTSFPNSLKLSKETVSLPIYPSLTNEQVNIILSVLVKK